MEFDKNRVYTALNADELKAGDKVIVADTLDSLKKRVESNHPTTEIIRVLPETEYARFCVDAGSPFAGHSIAQWVLAYLVEHVPEKKWRPYKDCDEMIADFKRRYGNAINADNPMWHPLIWVREREKNCNSLCVAFYQTRHVAISERIEATHLNELFDRYTYLDGSPCGVEE